jgi:DNA-binding Lrp family transcriptional regulator
MPKVTYVSTDGGSTTLDVPTGLSVMMEARLNDVDGIVGECGGHMMWSTTVDAMVDSASAMPEVQAVHTIAGDPDALVLVRVRDIPHLQQTIDTLRRGGSVTSTKTLMVLGSWSRES